MSIKPNEIKGSDYITIKRKTFLDLIEAAKGARDWMALVGSIRWISIDH